MNAAALRTAVLGVLAFALVAGITTLAPGMSSATYTAQTANAANSVGAAADWTPPTVSVTAPAAPLRDIATVTATASDAESGIRQVVLQVQAAGASTWTTLCTATASPYTCTWDTRAVADGWYSLRAIATDKSGYSTTSAIVAATVGNTIGVVLADPGDTVAGTVALSTTLQNTGAGPYAVRVEYSVAGSNTWVTLCSGIAAPYDCSWNTRTTTLKGTDSYDLRSAATYNGVTTYSAVVADVLVDNGAPTATMADPGTPLSGTVTLSATASDALSGVAKVVIQYAPNGSSTWVDACTLTATPYSCRFATTALPAGFYSFRALATDQAGNVGTPSVVSGRQVDNSVASVSMEDPGAFLTGTVTLTSTASTSAGIANVAIQMAPNGSSAFTTICTVTASPFTCAWNSKSVADGLYDFRAVMTDRTGVTKTSAVMASRRVDNRAVRGVDVQTANGTGTPGRLDAGDTVTFTYSTQMSPASILAGWSGAGTAVTLRLRDGGLLGLGSADDTLDVQSGSASVNLGSVDLRGDYLKNNKTSTFTATMTATSATVNGLPVTVVQLSVGTLISGGALRTAPASAAASMVWTPSNLAKDLGATTSSNAPVTESGALDREF
ncbi:Ig-like domain-containing protein [Microbacterium sp. AZCO]|uniref:Ig-like domain-containing protein n=1 Tax=Microbacterium sp. AZCO TaxID=3142976 RepID=UPI0031F4061E